MDLVKAARIGQESAFLQLFDEHRLPLFRFAYRMTGSVADAEDIVQECFLELLRPGSLYDPALTPIRTYLFGVVRSGEFSSHGYASDCALTHPATGTERQRHRLV